MALDRLLRSACRLSVRVWTDMRRDSSSSSWATSRLKPRLARRSAISWGWLRTSLGSSIGYHFRWLQVAARRLASQPQAGPGGGRPEAHAEQDISEGNQPLTISQQAPGIQGKGGKCGEGPEKADHQPLLYHGRDLRAVQPQAV